MNKCSTLFAAVAIALAFIQYGCGGGEGERVSEKKVERRDERCDERDERDERGVGGVLSPVMDAHGSYRGHIKNNLLLEAMVLDDGFFYAFYANDENLGTDRLLMGNLKAWDGTLSSSDVIDYDLRNSKTQKITVSAAYASKDWLSGTLVYPDVGGESVGFATKYNANYEKTPTLAAIEGTYKSWAKGLGIGNPAEVSIGNGYITFNSQECKAKGTVTPCTFGNVYSVTLNFDKSNSCAYSEQRLSGFASLDKSHLNYITLVARAADTSHPLLFSAGKW